MRALLAAIRATLWPAKRRPKPAPLALVADPYRSTPPRRRYELRVDDFTIEADTFREVVDTMRMLGCSNDEIIEAAIVAVDRPRGGQVNTGRGFAAMLARTGMKVGKRYD